MSKKYLVADLEGIYTDLIRRLEIPIHKWNTRNIVWLALTDAFTFIIYLRNALIEKYSDRCYLNRYVIRPRVKS